MGGQMAAEPAEAAMPTTAKKKVLVIDDDRRIVELIRHTVALHGQYDVLVAYDGVQGLERFYDERPDCVIVDVLMPRMDGYQVVRAIRGDAASAQTPLIILSALYEETDQLAGFWSGVDEYVAKPFKPTALCQTLDRVMQITPEERERRIEELAHAAAVSDGDSQNS
jgi:DNA-binding response OmpR family regulator